jgi:hypothetical protein
MTIRAQVALDKKRLRREIAREEKRKARAHLRELRDRLRAARARRTQAIIEAKERCRTERLMARERALALRERVLRELRESMQAERAAARETCSQRLAEARAIQDEVARARAELIAERQYGADLRRIERANLQRFREAPSATRMERISESDDSVRSSLPPELVPLFERVKRGIKASPRMSRLERFLEYAESHPSEVLASYEDKTDELVRELERREREAARALKRGRRLRPTEGLEEAPF